jgi:hypothetical protein
VSAVRVERRRSCKNRLWISPGFGSRIGIGFCSREVALLWEKHDRVLRVSFQRCR